MAERLKRAAAWLGLVTDDRYAEYDDADSQELTEGLSREELIGAKAAQQPAGTPTGPEKAASVTPLEPRRTAASAAATPTPPASHPRMADVSRIITVHPRTYNEARTIGEHFREGIPVIMNLTDMDDSDAKRLVDFSAGLVFGLHGSIERVTQKVFLLTPANVEIAAEDKSAIAEGGFFNQS